MLQNLVLLLTGTDLASNTLRAITVDSDEAMTSALRAIAADPPGYCLAIDGGRQRLNCGKDSVLAMVPHVDPLPPAPGAFEKLGDDVVAVGKEELDKLKSEAALAGQLCAELRGFAKDGGALHTLKQMVSQIRDHQASKSAEVPPAKSQA